MYRNTAWFKTFASFPNKNLRTSCSRYHLTICSVGTFMPYLPFHSRLFHHDQNVFSWYPTLHCAPNVCLLCSRTVEFPSSFSSCILLGFFLWWTFRSTHFSSHTSLSRFSWVNWKYFHIHKWFERKQASSLCVHPSEESTLYDAVALHPNGSSWIRHPCNSTYDQRRS